jgi:hypothetical protein
VNLFRISVFAATVMVFSGTARAQSSTTSAQRLPSPQVPTKSLPPLANQTLVPTAPAATMSPGGGTPGPVPRPGTTTTVIPFRYQAICQNRGHLPYPELTWYGAIFTTKEPARLEAVDHMQRYPSHDARVWMH